MKIRIIESYDSELGYDDDKYYEINNYKNMVIYAQTNKHKQGLEGITLDFDSLIEDLKKKKILIKSEFEDIKASDLEKHYDYFVLPDDFVNDIIFQLGFEPSKKRAYQNNEVEYFGKIISDVEFEQIISDENNDTYWLSEAKFKNAKIIVERGRLGGTNAVNFKSGVWMDGDWKDGIFEDSTWLKGTWEDGIFKKSNWKNGIWEKGNFFL